MLVTRNLAELHSYRILDHFVVKYGIHLCTASVYLSVIQQKYGSKCLLIFSFSSQYFFGGEINVTG